MKTNVIRGSFDPERPCTHPAYFLTPPSHAGGVTNKSKYIFMEHRSGQPAANVFKDQNLVMHCNRWKKTKESPEAEL